MPACSLTCLPGVLPDVLQAINLEITDKPTVKANDPRCVEGSSLAHSPQYLAQLWRLAEEACQQDLYVPLEFDTEWISEDPYHTSSGDDTVNTKRNLLRTVELGATWSRALD